ncbi:small ribosomal subunit Rsm22 family protein [Sulfobacillus harzensis]|uniref:rRNA methyltransferase n=1 Tax=Sulfobacillus harzensis TaxID=2729629 RepID=A0A7Y0L938_9FIRM|nr:small ribosomal subunit Rsm22 family protein [Sulfobacillus harzensis]NMP24189.1 rRNA methyltransferase [Sulfobacillus harzensis]
MDIPFTLQEAINATLAEHASSLAQHSQALSDRYRQGRGSQGLNQREALAYAAARLPATYGAATAALIALRQVMPSLSPHTLLDVGTGPGTLLFAVTRVFPSVEEPIALEPEPAMRAMARELLINAHHPWANRVRWLDQPLSNVVLPKSDLVTASYVLNELPDAQANTAALALWQAANEALVIIEPGTPEAFERLRAIRATLIEHGARVAAPCPHEGQCPMAGGDWCHFAERIPRTQLHRRLKGGSAPYEDEKYAYLALVHDTAGDRHARILRHPRIEPGRIALTLCTPHGLRQESITKRNRERFRRARKASWGSVWPSEHAP